MCRKGLLYFFAFFASEKINRKDAKDAKILLVIPDASLKSG
jgi:hypothetical protein